MLSEYSSLLHLIFLYIADITGDIEVVIGNKFVSWDAPFVSLSGEALYACIRPPAFS